MSTTNWPEFWRRLQEIYQKEDRSLDAFTAEQPVLENALTAIAKNLEATFTLVEPLGRGGAGVVIRLMDEHLKIDRALKLPRPRQDDLVDSVRNEIDHLTQIRHDNIIRVYDLGAVPIPQYALPYPYFVMDFVKGVKSLRSRVEDTLSTATTTSALPGITAWLAKKLMAMAEALTYLHDHNTIHFDVKPANILIDAEDKPILSDLGFAKRRAEDAPPAVVGFTLFYAHPDLRSTYQHMSSQNRVRKTLAPKEFKFSWDIYAFGKTILEVLALIDRHFPDAVQYDYAFVYLHLMACRMLDGQNQAKADTDRVRERQTQNTEPLSVYRETWLNLSASDFGTIKYTSFKQVLTDLDELVYNRQCGERVAELSSFFSERVQISPGPPAVFSSRVKAIVEHPCFSRLGSVLQLGMLNTVYPGVTHTRLEHSLGSFKNCRSYLQALYHDPYNPLFRQLVTAEDLRAVLVASLVHDLGQFPLAHEIEEIEKGIKHERYTIAWLDNPTLDTRGRTMREIIENAAWGWGAPLGRVKSILAGQREGQLFQGHDLKDTMLSSIIDGPIDVDKLDYLIRDSQNAGLTYGDLIDIDRLIRHLTVVIDKDDNGHCILTIGAYEKGQSAAESLSFSRYLLYQALYWHRIARSARAMLREAIANAIQQRKAPSKGKKPTFQSAMEELLGISSEPRVVTTKDVLDLIDQWSNGVGKDLIRSIKARDYYKRLVTIHNEPEASGRQSLVDRFREVSAKSGFNAELQVRIRTQLEAHVALVEGPAASALAPERANEVIDILSKPGRILCDCPSPPYGSNETLRFIPEPQRLQRNYFSRVEVGERVSEVWQQVFFRLMNIAAKGRVFCDPRVRDTLMAALGPDPIRNTVKTLVDEF